MKAVVMRRNAKEFSDEDFDLLLENTSKDFIEDADFINLDDLYEENMYLGRFISKVENTIVEISGKYDILYIIDNQSLRYIISDIYDENVRRDNTYFKNISICYQLELLSGIINNFNGNVIIHKLKRDPNGRVIHD
jgi:hypothetical protein